MKSGADESGVPGVFRRRIGDIVVTAISDGYIDGTLELLRNVDLELARQVLVDSFRPVRRIDVNTFLITSEGRTALIDTGAGGYRSTTGRLNAHLAAVGVDPRSIDTVLLSHLHPDHSAGLSNTAAEAVFPNAELLMHEREPTYWLDDAAMARAGEHERKAFFLDQRELIAPYRNRTRLFTSGEVFPGVTAIPAFGHTPGHVAFLVASGPDQLMIWGDVVHLPEVQTAYPGAGVGFDVDLAQAADTRRRIFDQVAADRILIAGMHLHFPGFSHLSRRGDGYQLHPESWLQAV